MKRFLFLFCFLCFFSAFEVKANEVVKPSLYVEKIEPAKTFHAVLKLDLSDGWHVYWKTVGDAGEPSVLKMTMADGFVVEDVLYPFPEKFTTGNFTEYGYEKEAFVILKIRAPETLPKDLFFQADAVWMGCNGECRPDKKTFYGFFQKDKEDEDVKKVLEKAFQKIPERKQGAVFWKNETEILLEIQDKYEFSNAHFFPYGDLILHGGKQNFFVQNSKSYLTLTPFDKQNDFKEMSGVVVFYDKTNQAKKAVEIKAEKSMLTKPELKKDSKNMGFLTALFLAFLGGILLNLMPCVFPVLSLKAYALLHGHVDKRKKDALAYSAGVVSSFFLLALILIALRQTGETLGWGFQMQYPLFVFFMALLMFFLGLVFSGAVSVGEGFSSFFSRFDGRCGAFGTGLLAVLVATPCAAPFMGTALGYALGVSALKAMSVFICMGTGLAFPFLLLGFVPSFGKRLPKSGEWMIRLREFLAFPLYGACAWLIWVLTLQKGTTALAITSGCLILMSLVLWAKRCGKKTMLVFTMIFVVSVVFSVSALKENDNEKEKIVWENYQPEKVQILRQQNVPVFVKFSASWCLTCLLNENTTLKSETVKDLFYEKGVALFFADWTNRDEKIARTLELFGRGGVPLYVYYPAQMEEPVVLPQILTPKIIQDVLKPL